MNKVIKKTHDTELWIQVQIPLLDFPQIFLTHSTVAIPTLKGITQGNHQRSFAVILCHYFISTCFSFNLTSQLDIFVTF